MKGRKPKPAEIRNLQGNPGRRPVKQAPKTAPVDGRYPPSEWMDAEAKKEWRRVIKAYENIKMITETDLPLLMIWCTTLSQLITTLKIIEKMKKDKDTKASDIRVYTINAHELRGDLLTLAARFGFSPVDRMKLAIPPEKPKDENDIEKYLNRKKA